MVRAEMRRMDVERTVKVVVGTVLALLIACEPITDDSADASDEAGTGATGSVSSALVALPADALCKHLINDCQQTFDSESACLANYLPLRVSSACASAVATASCTDLADPSSAISQSCFPTCDATSTPATCHADGTITLCTTSATTHVNDCKQSCVSDGYTSWTGSCGTTFDGQTADQSQCWCQ